MSGAVAIAAAVYSQVNGGSLWETDVPLGPRAWESGQAAIGVEWGREENYKAAVFIAAASADSSSNLDHRIVKLGTPDLAVVEEDEQEPYEDWNAVYYSGYSASPAIPTAIVSDVDTWGCNAWFAGYSYNPTSGYYDWSVARVHLDSELLWCPFGGE